MKNLTLTAWLAIALCVSVIAYTAVSILDNPGGDSPADGLRGIVILLAGALVGQQAEKHMTNGNGKHEK